MTEETDVLRSRKNDSLGLLDVGRQRTERNQYSGAENHGTFQADASPGLHGTAPQIRRCAGNSAATETDRPPSSGLKDTRPSKDDLAFLNISVSVLSVETALPALLTAQSGEGLMS